MSQWIETAKQLPEKDTKVFILTLERRSWDDAIETGEYSRGQFMDRSGYKLKDGYVTHWLPIPSLPNQETTP